MLEQKSDRTTLVVFVVIMASIGAASLYLLPLPIAITSTGLGAVMLAITISDLRHFIIPDILSLPAIPAGLLLSGSLLSPHHHHLLIDPTHLAAMLLGGGLLWLVRQAYHLVRQREGLGLGDIKLAAVAGAWTGLEGLNAILLSACASALILVIIITLTRPKEQLISTRKIPFGAFLAPSIWIVWVAINSGWSY